MSCEYCHEDRDGYICPLDKNAHAYYHYPDALILRFGKEHRECKINYCQMCGRKLGGKTDNKRMTHGEKIRQMDDEELVSIVRCPASMDEYYEMNECLSITCSECKLKWLKEEDEHGSD